MAIDRGLNTTVSTNPLGIDDDDYNLTTRGPQGIDGASTQEYIDKYNAVLAAAITTATDATNAAISEASASANAVSSALSELAADTSETNAAASAAAAALSETNAGTSETNAATSATASASSAANALSSENAASGSETSASNSATAAATSATTATTQASTATTKAAEALASQTASATSATNAATSATAAATSLATFTGQYASSATAPSSPDTGDLWFDESVDIMKVYGSAGWANAGSSVNGVENSVQYIATAGQTTFSATYDAGYVDVYLNGILLATTDYTATDGANIVLDVGASVSDVVYIQAFGTFALADHYTKVASDARFTTAAYVDTEIAALVDSSPATLDTLNELAAALGDDPNFATTVTNSIATKAPIASPSFTGTVVADGLTLDNAQYISFKNSSSVPTRALGINGANTFYVGGIDADIGPILFVDNGATLATLGSSGLDVTGTVTADDLTLNGTGAAGMPVGTTAQRPTAATGQFRFNTTDTTFEGYNGTEWGPLAGGGGEFSKITYEYIATAGQTTFSGVDLNGQTLSYTAGNTLVTYGGADLPFSDFTATNGTSIVLADGAVAGKIVRIVAFTAFAVADTYTQAQIDAKDAATGAQDGVFYENSTNVTSDYTITTNKNAMSAGPITVNSGVTVTVPVGSVWSIV